MMTTAPDATTFKIITVYNSTCERIETIIDVAADSRRRLARGERSRNTLSEPARLSPGPWFSFTRPDDDTKPYAVVETTYAASKSKGNFDEPMVRVWTGTGHVELDAQDIAEAVMDNASARRLGLRLTGGTLAEERAAAAAARRQAERDAEAQVEAEAAKAREEARRAREAKAAAALASPVPPIGASVWYWRLENVGAGFTGARERLAPSPAVVFATAALPGRPPGVGLMAFDAGGATPRHDVEFSAEPKEGRWTWPVADFTGNPWVPASKPPARA